MKKGKPDRQEMRQKDKKCWRRMEGHSQMEEQVSSRSGRQHAGRGQSQQPSLQWASEAVPTSEITGGREGRIG